MKLNSVCANLALQIKPSWGSWTLCCHRHLPKCVLGERGTKPQGFPAGWWPVRGRDAIPQQQPWQVTGRGVERKIMRTTTPAVQKRALEDPWTYHKAVLSGGKTTSPAPLWSYVRWPLQHKTENSWAFMCIFAMGNIPNSAWSKNEVRVFWWVTNCTTVYRINFV